MHKCIIIILIDKLKKVFYASFMIEKDIENLINDAKQLSKNFEVRLKYNDQFKANEDEFVLDSININAAFFPAVWVCLSVTQKLAAIIIASKWHNVKLNKFCFEPKLYYEILVFDGKDVCFNISSLGDVLLDSVDFLTEILNYKNQKKLFHFKAKSKEKNFISDYKTFEELSYAVNIKLSAENATDFAKALYLDQKPLRDYRNAKFLALNFVLDYVIEIDADEIKENYISQLEKIVNDNQFVVLNLGQDEKVRDYYYLNAIKNKILNTEGDLSLIDSLYHFKKHFGEDFIEMIKIDLV